MGVTSQCFAPIVLKLIFRIIIFTLALQTRAGTIPEALGNLSALEYLSLSNNRLEGNRTVFFSSELERTRDSCILFLVVIVIFPWWDSVFSRTFFFMALRESVSPLPVTCGARETSVLRVTAAQRSLAPRGRDALQSRTKKAS